MIYFIDPYRRIAAALATAIVLIIALAAPAAAQQCPNSGGDCTVTSGTLLINTSSNFYGGNTNISSGATLEIANGGRLFGFGDVTNAGTFQIDAGGTGHFLSTLTTTGTVTVQGALSLGVLNANAGSVTVSNGGSVTDYSLTMGIAPGTSSLTVTGAGTSYTSQANTQLGAVSGANVSLTVSNGASFTTTDDDIGSIVGSTATVIVTGPGTTFKDTFEQLVGNHGTGTLIVSNGALVTVETSPPGGGNFYPVFIGGNPALAGGGNGTGTVIVTDPGSIYNVANYPLYVGYSGIGTLTVANGGNVTINGGTGTIFVANQPGSTGTINIGAPAGQAPVAPGTISASTISFGAGTGSIVFNHTSSNYAFAPAMTGSGSVVLDAGTTIFTGANSYTGGTSINGATLKLSGAGTLGASSGTTTLNGSMLDLGGTTQTQAAVTLAGGTIQNGALNAPITSSGGAISNLSDSQSLTTIGGITTLAGTDTFGGGVTVNGGTLTGAASVTGNVQVNNGGTLAPGNAANPTGTLTIGGNLAFQSGALYLVSVAGANAGSTNVVGTATLGGASVQVNVLPGAYTKGQTWNILTANAISGQFGGVTVLNFTASVSDPPASETLTLTGATLGSTTLLNANQQRVATGINNFFNNGGTITPAFGAIFGLTGLTLASALTQLSGEVATDAQAGAFQLMNQFLNLMVDPFTGDRGGGSTSGGAMGFAPERAANLPPDIALAYASVFKAAPAAPPVQTWNVWGSAYGGGANISGDPIAGTNDVSARTYGYVGGADYRITRDTLVGFAIGGGGTNWSVAQGLGSGRSDAFQAGLYAKTFFGPAYVAASLGFADHWMTTNRISAMFDQLTASFNAQSYGGRVEGGYRFAVTPASGITPYAAAQVQSFHTPFYQETDVTGGGFGLAFNARNATDTRSEIGARFDQLATIGSYLLTLHGRFAWAHDWVSDPSLGAVFQALPGSSFIVNGATPAHDYALTTFGADLHLSPHWVASAKFEGELAARTQSYSGLGKVTYSW